MCVPRPEYPRPQFVREQWLNLNGEWEFSFDTAVYDRKIIVPFAHQTEKSGVNIQDFHDVVWYRKRFDLPEEMEDSRILLHFGAVDYSCDVWVNDIHMMHHEGGHVSFEVEITSAVRSGNNEIVVKAEDHSDDLEMPRGKQYWEEKSSGIFYTRTTGIWQTVWIEAVPQTYLKNVFMTPDLDNKSVKIEYEMDGEKAADLEIVISYEGTELTRHMISGIRNSGNCQMGLDQQGIGIWQSQEEMCWTPEKPRLFDVAFRVVKDGETADRVTSYFGLRKVSVSNGIFMLNNKPYFQKLLLDQGYWEESLLTAPEDEAFVTDIKLAKEMGFNGVRKHQKVEDPRFLYHADKMGFLVWGEIPAAYVYSRCYVRRITDEWMAAVMRDYNHPSIVAWTPLNESWGVVEIMNQKEEQCHSAAMVYLTKSLDQTRMVISNDGWEHTCTDLLTIHDYEPDKEVLSRRYSSMESILASTPSGREMFARGWEYKGQPVLVTEFGGISYQKGSWTGWGYSNAVSDEDYAKRYHAVISAMLESPCIQGFCYTQITDVEQEINGIMTYDRKPKIDPAVIRAINEGKWKPEE